LLLSRKVIDFLLQLSLLQKVTFRYFSVIFLKSAITNSRRIPKNFLISSIMACVQLNCVHCVQGNDKNNYKIRYRHKKKYNYVIVTVTKKNVIISKLTKKVL